MIPNHLNAPQVRRLLKRHRDNADAMAQLLTALTAQIDVPAVPKGSIFLNRVCTALDTTSGRLATTLGFSTREMHKLKRMQRVELIAMTTNDTPMWAALAQHINERIGRLLGLREELARKLRDSEKRRIGKRLEQEANDPNP